MAPCRRARKPGPGWQRVPGSATFERMTRPDVLIHFDFVDPLSYVAWRAFAERAGDLREAVSTRWVGLELRPPPLPMTSTHDPFWAARWRRAAERAASVGFELSPPRVAPWSRKAHELVFFAAHHGVEAGVRGAIFEAYFERAGDIGRIDVLVDIAVEFGLDRDDTKATLDVDKHAADVLSARIEAKALGVRDVPAMSADGKPLEGFPDPSTLLTLLP
jgi:predicted DsbA family dithiol-disulfide isomerase